ncbi:MAG: DUF932 domain-containing protein [Iphinoe sp. HA4291-MV1]|jgi:hypothetical protein|nr:DUF932 domain-containing protein [Iphinoe sp. HA4291-MV1]
MSDLLKEYLYRGVGINVEIGMSVEDQMRLSRLDWRVEVAQGSYQTKDGREMKNKTRTAYRSDTGEELSPVSLGWKPYQNVDFLKNFNEFCSRTGMVPERIGYLTKSQSSSIAITHKIFASAIIPKELGGQLWLDRDDIIDSRLVFFNHHNYGQGAGALIYTVRRICTNGQVARETAARGKLRHISAHLGANSKRPTVLLASIHQGLKNYNEKLESLTRQALTDDEVQAMLIKDYGDSGKPWDKQPPIVKTVMSIYKGELDNLFSDRGVNLGQATRSAYKTAYGLLQAVSAYRNHFCSSSISGSSQLLSLWEGEARNDTNKMFDSLVRAYIPRKHTTSVAQQVAVHF